MRLVSLVCSQREDIQESFCWGVYCVFANHSLCIQYMKCKICGISNESLDYVECEECPTMICNKCDDSTTYMTLDKHAVVRCPVCSRIKDMKDQIAEVSGDFSHQDPAGNRYAEPRGLDHVLHVSEAVKQMVARGEIAMENQYPDPNAQNESSSGNVHLYESNSIVYTK